MIKKSKLEKTKPEELERRIEHIQTHEKPINYNSNVKKSLPQGNEF